MDNRYILTAFGKDRPGIVADVTRILFENGCNLEDNSMTRLADEFTLILLFTCPSTGLDEQLARECRRLEKDAGISAFIRPLEKRQEVPHNGMTERTLHVEGMDHAGIVYKVSQYLAGNDVNIVALKSTVRESPESGSAIYQMDIHIQIPDGVPLDRLEEGLSAVADELLVDITVSR